jgi:hypothetical protein
MYLSICFFIVLSWLLVRVERGKMKLLLLRYIDAERVCDRFVLLADGRVVYLCAAAKSPRLTRRPSQGQKGL